MAFKGTWHQADGPTNNGGSARAAGDRRYPSSNDSYNNYSHPGPNPIGLAPMNYSTNPNSMYSGTTMMSGSGTNYSSGGKSSAYTGTVSNLYRDYGVIDNEISFKMNAVIGPMPRVGDRVICQMKQADAFGPQTPYKYYGFDVRIASNAPDPRRAPPRPSTGNSQGMTRNSDSYANRSQSSSMKRGVAPSNSSTNNNHRDRSRPSKPTAPPAKRNSRPTTPKYSCTLPKGTLDCSELNVIELRSRYSRLHIPSDFYHASYKWHQTIPLDHPLKFLTPCSFHIFNKNVPRLMTKHTSVLDPEDADYRWNVRVLLMSNPDLQTLIQRSCMISSEKKSSTNPDDYEHPSKLIKFLVAVRNQNEYFPLGGPWSPSLDGADPERDPQVLIRTAIRCVHAQTGIDLSECLQWCRYLELRYHRPEEIHKGRLIESRVENVVVFLPDVASSSMPSTLQWEEIVHVYRQACQEELAEELNENSNATTQNDEISSNEETAQTQPTHYSQLQLDQLKLDQLKNELKARGQAIHGIKLDLKRRLAKILHQEKVEEEKLEDSSSFVEEKDHSSSDIDKLRKEIEMKYQLPSHRAILVHPTDARGDRFDCRIVSLHYLLNYANKDTIREKCFELYLFSESFFEMLMRDSIYQIYRSLYSCLEVTETKTTENEEEHPPAVAAAPPTTLELSVHDDELETDENGKKRKRSPSKDDETNQKKKTRLRTVLPELLFAFTFFDRNRSGYLVEKDLEELLLCGGLALTKNEVNKLVSRIVEDDKIRYHQLTDKLLPVDEGESETFPIETEIDPQAPKGNLHLLPSTSSIDETQQTNISLDHQRAMKQLEVSHRIQTGLELKIDKLKKEIHQLTDDLHNAQKSSRTATEQLNETKKRLRETQQDLKELDEKYKRYSDALYRVRSESRSTFDHLTRVLGIKEKSSSQSISSKSEEEMKKVPTTNEIEQNNETAMKSEETNPTEMIVNDQSL